MASHSLPDGVPEDCHALIRRGVEYWISIHPAEGLPGRQHLDPVDIPELLPHVRLIEFAGDPPQFKIRLMGTRMVEFFENDFTGQWCHEAFPKFAGSHAEKALTDSARTGRPNWRRGAPSYFHQKDYKATERVALPLAADGRHVDMLLLVHVYN